MKAAYNNKNGYTYLASGIEQLIRNYVLQQKVADKFTKEEVPHEENKFVC